MSEKEKKEKNRRKLMESQFNERNPYQGYYSSGQRERHEVRVRYEGYYSSGQRERHPWEE
jgi:hypothetical protein